MTRIPGSTEELTAQVRELVIETLLLDGGGATGDADPLAERRLDSVAIIQLLAALEDRFAIQIPPEEITADNFSSTRVLAGLVARLAQS